MVHGKACGNARCVCKERLNKHYVHGQAPGEEVKDDSQYFESLSVFVSKVRGEAFTWEQARDMTFKDIAKNVEVSSSPHNWCFCMRMLHALLLREQSPCRFACGLAKCVGWASVLNQSRAAAAWLRSRTDKGFD